MIATGLPGVTITQGTVGQVQVIAHTPMNRNLERQYNIIFRPHAELPLGGKIKMFFPGEFNGLTADTCSVVNGLTATTGSSVTCTLSGLEMEFSNFNAVPATTIEVQVKATNPSTATVSSYFRIYTYNSANTLIDANEEAAQLHFSHIDTMVNVDTDMFTVKTDQIINQYGPIEFFLQTRTTVPATTGGNTGRIELTLPYQNNVNADAAVSGTAPLGYSCLFGRAKVPASACKYDDTTKVITIDTPATEDFESCPLAVVVTTLPGTGTPSNEVGFRIPMTEGGSQHPINVKVYINDNTSGNHQEEAEFFYTTKPKPFKQTLGGIPPEFRVKWFHRHEDMWNVLEITFQPEIKIPNDGWIEVEFKTSNYGFPFDLGWGMVSFAVVDYPCIFYHDPVTGTPTTITECKLTAGTTVIPAVIKMQLGGDVAVDDKIKITLPRIKNGPYDDHMPMVTVRTMGPRTNSKNDQFVALEESDHYIGSITEPTTATDIANAVLIDQPASTITGGYVANQETAPHNTWDATQSYKFVLKHNVGVAMTGTDDDDYIVIMMPRGYKWYIGYTTPDEYFTPETMSASGDTGPNGCTTALTDMVLLANDNAYPRHNYRFSNDKGWQGFILHGGINNFSGDIEICYDIAFEHAWDSIPNTIEYYVIKGGVVDNYETNIGSSTANVHTITPNTMTVTLEESDLGQVSNTPTIRGGKTLWKVTFTTIKALYAYNTSNPTIYVYFNGNFSSVESTCFRIKTAPTGTTCSGSGTTYTYTLSNLIPSGSTEVPAGT